jgi:hypothetical protein
MPGNLIVGTMKRYVLSTQEIIEASDIAVARPFATISAGSIIGIVVADAARENSCGRAVVPFRI